MPITQRRQGTHLRPFLEVIRGRRQEGDQEGSPPEWRAHITEEIVLDNLDHAIKMSAAMGSIDSTSANFST